MSLSKSNITQDGKKLAMHSKIVTINGNFEGKTNAKVVFAGSQNFSGSATTSFNETLMRIDGSDNYARYAKNFDTMLATHSKNIAASFSGGRTSEVDGDE